MSEMVEKVARAICRASGFEPDHTDHLDRVFWTLYTQEARAAIKAMMEPTEKMIEAGDYQNKHAVLQIRATWFAMLTAALEDD